MRVTVTVMVGVMGDGGRGMAHWKEGLGGAGTTQGRRVQGESSGVRHEGDA